MSTTPQPYVILIPDGESYNKPDYPIIAPPGMPRHEAKALVETVLEHLGEYDDQMGAYETVCAALEPHGFVSPAWERTDGEI